jgi:hypothetical protein
MSLCPESTQVGRLPPWEVAKAAAYHNAITDIAEHLKDDAAKLLGMSVAEYVAKKLTLQGGGHPTKRAVKEVIAKTKEPGWYPGKPPANVGGRPPTVTGHQKKEIARVAMDLKRQVIAPTPRNVRARLPATAVNRSTGEVISDKTFHRVYKEHCFDSGEDDPWHWLASPEQDMLPERLKPWRVRCAKHILATQPANAWWNMVAVDPCSSLLPKTADRQHEQKVAAMGKLKWMSKKSRRVGINLRPPKTALTQANKTVNQVHWTVVFARGKIAVYLCDPEAAKTNEDLPKKLNDSVNLSKFVRLELPKVLEQMRKEHKWTNIPRTLVHDKASYMVSAAHDKLNRTFSTALEEAGFHSWIGGESDSADWLPPKCGDLYLHETAIAHIRRLLGTKFATARLSEDRDQFRERLDKVTAHMNGPDFAKANGAGLVGLAKEIRQRCENLITIKGERLPK